MFMARQMATSRGGVHGSNRLQRQHLQVMIEKVVAPNTATDTSCFFLINLPSRLNASHLFSLGCLSCNNGSLKNQSAKQLFFVHNKMFNLPSFSEKGRQQSSMTQYRFQSKAEKIESSGATSHPSQIHTYNGHSSQTMSSIKISDAPQYSKYVHYLYSTVPPPFCQSSCIPENQGTNFVEFVGKLNLVQTD